MGNEKRRMIGWFIKNEMRISEFCFCLCKGNDNDTGNETFFQTNESRLIFESRTDENTAPNLDVVNLAKDEQGTYMLMYNVIFKLLASYVTNRV